MFAKVLSTALALSPLLVSSSPIAATPAMAKQAVGSGPGKDFMGSLSWYPQQPAYMLATVSNNSTTHYAILAKNNLFDDAHPFNPFSVTTLSGTKVTLMGTRYGYPDIDDTQFKDFAPGTVWERYFNMSDYMPPSASIQTPTSQCFSFQLPPTVEALNLDNAKPGQHLADLFFSEGLAEVTLDSNPIHYNVTIAPGTPTTGAASAAQTIPAEPSGIYLAPSQQSGSALDLLESNSQDASAILDGYSFNITRGSTTS